ncbi:MAG TPA: tripartite tricarboxylate transporter substrate binding protein [Burkholderiales bacterium]|nr:tripartite tricarboxylate transporter substrate binding protein [Burkholderiales bacterium]
MNKALCTLATLAVIVAAGSAPGSAPAQAYPTKPVRIVVPFPPGGVNDIAARVLAPPLTRALGQNVIVENRPGGNIVIGTEYVARSAPDGHTVLLMGFSFMANAALRKNLPYDTLRDFTGVARIENSPFIVSVHPSVPARTMGELVALARKHPGKLSYANQGTGTGQHLVGEMIKATAKIDMLHVPYQGGGPSLIAVLGGHAEVLISTIPTIATYIPSGRIRPLAVSSLARAPNLPDVPTLAESGSANFELTNNLGVVAPVATPRAVVNRLSGEILKALDAPEAKAAMVKAGIMVSPLTAEPFTAVIQKDVQTIARVVKDTGLKLD